MPTPTPGGFIGGWMAGEQHQQDMAINQLAYEEESLKYQAAKDEMESKQRMAETATRVLQEHKDKGEDLPQAVLNTSYAMADFAFQNGNPVQGMEYVEKAAGAQEKIASARIKVNEASIQNMQILQQDLAAVTDDASWRGLWTRYSINHPEAANDPRIRAMVQEQISKPYDPVWIQHLRDATTSQLDKARIEQVQAQTALERSRVKTEDYRRGALSALAEQRKARTDQLRKNGYTEAPLKTAEVTAATNLISSRLNTAAPEAMAKAKTVANEVALRARQIQAAEGVSAPRALDQAYNEALAAGRLAGLRPARRGPGSFDNPKIRVQGETPIAGQWYTGAPGTKAAGVVAFYDGTKYLTKEEMAGRMSSDLGNDEEIDEPDNYPDEGEE